MEVVVKITKKGQATIPKKLRKKFGFKDRAIVFETKEGLNHFQIFLKKKVH